MAQNFWSSEVEGKDGRLDAPAFHRNVEPIFAVLEPHLRGKRGTVLETGSGTGQHAVEYARRLPEVVWQPGDQDEAMLKSTEAWRLHSKLPNLRPPLFIDLAENWTEAVAPQVPPASLLAIFCANVIHISPWKTAEGLFGKAAALLRPGGKVFLYGPFKRDGEHTAPSNASFDESLRARDPEWGLRDMNEVRTLAEKGGLSLAETVPMPANNFTLIFARG